MTFNLEKWINNKTDANFKRIFNDNVDKINGIYGWFTKRDKAINSRVDNLVLRSGGTSPNEVVDGRVGFDGKQYATLKARLDAEYKMFAERQSEYDKRLTSYDKKIAFLEEQLRLLYSQKSETVTLYVSKDRGNDKTADGTEEKPFKTIQASINTIARINSTNYVIDVDKGAYLEDVRISDINATSIFLKSSNYETIAAYAKDTGHYVKSISVSNCPNIIRVGGFTATNVASSDRFITVANCPYATIVKCSNQTNTKSREYKNIYFSSASGHIYESDFSNQQIVLSADFSSVVIFANANKGTGNTTAIHSQRSIVYDVGSGVEGEKVKALGGQIF